MPLGEAWARFDLQADFLFVGLRSFNDLSLDRGLHESVFDQRLPGQLLEFFEKQTIKYRGRPRVMHLVDSVTGERISVDGQDRPRTTLDLVVERELFGVFEASRSDAGLEISAVGVQPLEAVTVSEPLLEVESIVRPDGRRICQR